jgi:hypothetical protein
VPVKSKKKTDQILEFFKSSPNKDFAPADISHALGYEPKLVASVLGRLVLQGTLIKDARGKYRYALTVSYDYERIIDEARSVLKSSFGEGIIGRLGLNRYFDDLASFLSVLKDKFGSRMATNLLKHAVLKNYKGKKANAIINQLGL